MYVSLYRKYRPKTFDEMIGQGHITQILKNQIKAGRIGHAYLFTGARGTGKTSAAKILARAVNCEAPIDGNPCNKCGTCLDLLQPSCMDILEIDAASNNRVDEIRELREKIQFTPVVGKYKVYIIDEVHMLSDSAFNALLKTLEEPPAHAVFVLATTEIQKLPATVLSRCMRFDYKLVPSNVIAALIEKIFKEEGKAYEPSAVSYIASAAEGSVRDGLSIADMAMSTSGKLKYEDILELLGATDFSTLAGIAKAVLSKNVGQCFSLIDATMKSGKSVGVLIRDLIKYFRDLLVAVSVEGAEKILDLPNEYYTMLKKEAAGADISALFDAIEVLSAAEGDLRYTVSPRIVLEAAVLRIINKTQVQAQSIPQTQQQTQPAAEQAPAADPKRQAAVLWGKVVRNLREMGAAALYAVAGNIIGNGIDGDNYIINAVTPSDVAILTKEENMATLKKLLSENGGSYNIIVAKGVEVEEKKTDDLSKLNEYVGKDKLKIE